LPGDARLRPLAVRVDGQPAAVLLRGGMPMLRLPRGEVEVSGELHWERRPETIAIPDESGIVALTLDGAPVAVAERDGGRLWLGRSETRVGADALSLRVYRLIADGAPQRLTTELALDVAGRAREIDLGRVLPADFVPVALHSPLPAQLNGEGRLRLQLRPGAWRVRIDARGLTLAERFQPVSLPEPWPSEEIWSWRAAPEFRIAQPLGERPVDPAQVGAPWDAPLPTFVLTGDEALRIEQRARGVSGARPHRLSLQRTLWLDFSGTGFTVRDRIRGELAHPGRLDLRAPWRLQRVAEDGNDLLITQGPKAGLEGVELRERVLDLDATARLDGRELVHASGWAQDFESMQLTLQLPPGWRLLHAAGADSAPGAWLERWRLLDLFLLALSALIAYRLRGWGFAAVVAVYLLLAYHERGAPLWSLLVVMLLGLLLALLPAGRLHGAVAHARRGLWLLALLLALPFAAQQLKLALYPQLEQAAVGRGEVPYARSFGYAEMAPAEAEQAAPQAMPEAKLDRMEAAGARVPMAPPPAPAPLQDIAAPLDRYPSDAILQAGPGVPDWQWRHETIGWNGPVLAEQPLDLRLAPPWLTRAARLAVVALLGLILWRLAAGVLSATALRRWLAAAGLALGVLAPAAASEYPPPELLNELRQRLLAPPKCAPDCAALAAAEVELDGERLRLALQWHAAADTAVPMPQGGRGWRPLTIKLNGADSELRLQDGQAWLRVPRGVHRVELLAQVAAVDAFDIGFPLPPAEIRVSAPGWDIAGVDQGRLLSGSLQLVRRREASGEGLGRQPAAEFPPFVQITRTLLLDLDWSINTRVERIAPAQAGFTLYLPLLEGERIQDDTREVTDDGRVRVAFAAGEAVQYWRSQLPIGERIRLTSGGLAQASERWEVRVGPFWHAEFSGVPELAQDLGDDVRRFQPLPGETLEISVTRPQAVAGSSVAIDEVTLTQRVGRRASDVAVRFDLRSTRGGQHVLQLPVDVELIRVSLRGEEQHLELDQGRLSLAVVPGSNPVEIEFRVAQGVAPRVVSPSVDLGAAAANLRVELQPPPQRWLLALGGAGVGPAVLFWPQFLLLIGLAWALGRSGLTPLRGRHWFGLGIGFSTVSWLAAMPVVAWLLALGLRQRRPPAAEPRWRFMLIQLGLAALTALALLCLVAAIPYGLLGQPDMEITGNGSSAAQLNWFIDRTDGTVPQVWLLSLPLWVYQLALLVWALWLANALIGWLRWAWQSFSTGGYWPARRVIVPESSDAPSAAAQGDDERG